MIDLFELSPETLTEDEIASAFSKLTEDILNANLDIDLKTVQKCLSIILWRMETPKLAIASSASEDEFKIFIKFNIELSLHFRKTRCVTDYGNKLGLSNRKLSLICTKFCKRSAKEMINERIITEAKLHLSATNVPLKTVAAELGFLDQYQFSTFFKRYTNKSPSDFRKMLLEN